VFSASARVEAAELKTVKADPPAQELRYLGMLDSLPDGVCCLDERKNNCDEIQGYYLSRPLAAAGLEQLVRAKSVYSGRVDEPV